MRSTLLDLAVPVYERLSGRAHWTEARRLGDLQWHPPGALQARALARLRALLEHAAVHVPYYRDAFARAGIAPGDVRDLTHLSRVPITTKAALRDRFPSATTADNLPERRRWKSRTSGSTGFPFEFYTDLAAADTWRGSYLFFLGWAGVSVLDTNVVIAAQLYRRYAANTPAGSPLLKAARRLVFGARVAHLSGVDLDATRLAAEVGRLSSRSPYFIQAYPSYAAHLAADMLRRGFELPIRPKAVIGITETLTAANAAAIAQAFRCGVVSHYSAWEVLHLAQTCPDNPAVLHVNSERAVVRVVRDDGRDAAPGERGRVLLTDLSNLVMPFINYDIGDRAVLGPPCPCGRGFPTLSSLEGRVGEVIRTPSGRIVAPGALERLLTFVCDIVPHVVEYQAEQLAEDAVVVRVVPTPRFTAAFAEKLRQDVRDFMGADMTVAVEVVDRVPLEASGKRLIIKALAADGAARP